MALGDTIDGVTYNEGWPCGLSSGARAMKPLSRKPVHKGRSVKKFRREADRTKAANVRQVMRGGWRL